MKRQKTWRAARRIVPGSMVARRRRSKARRGVASRSWVGALGSTLLIAEGCSVPEPEPAPDPAAETEADRAFNAATTRDRADGWVRYFAEDGSMMVPGGRITGLDSIRAAIAPGLADGGHLTWEPEWGEVAGSADLGFTVGRYESHPPGSDDPEAVATGQYVTIWRKDPSGAWKVVLDTGAPDPT